MPDLVISHSRLRALANLVIAGIDSARFSTQLFQPLEDLCESPAVAGAVAGATATQSWAATGLSIGLHALSISAVAAATEFEATDAQLARQTYSPHEVG